MSTVDVNRVIVTGENSAIRLSPTDGECFTTNASFWRILSSEGGSGHVLYLNSELTGGRWRITGQHCAGALAAVDRHRRDLCRTSRPEYRRDRCAIQQIR